MDDASIWIVRPLAVTASLLRGVRCNAIQLIDYSPRDTGDARRSPRRRPHLTIELVDEDHPKVAVDRQDLGEGVLALALVAQVDRAPTDPDAANRHVAQPGRELRTNDPE